MLPLRKAGENPLDRGAMIAVEKAFEPKSNIILHLGTSIPIIGEKGGANMLLTDEMYNQIGDWVEAELKFRPCHLDRQAADAQGILPFQISQPHAVYGLEDMAEDQAEYMYTLVLGALQAVTPKGGLLYALDWQHSGFLFDPRNPADMQSIYVENARYYGGGYHAYFPDFYPDGDYYFFIDQNLSFGYLSHPWRQEVWIFGEALVEQFEAICPKLGLKKIK